MRNGRWSIERDFGEGSAAQPGFPPQPNWFEGIKDFPNIAVGLAEVGFSADEIADIMGLNWLRFYEQNFGAPAQGETTG